MSLTQQTKRDLKVVLETLDQRIYELSSTDQQTSECTQLRSLRTRTVEVLSAGT